jgi:hypothetical protein
MTAAGVCLGLVIAGGARGQMNSSRAPDSSDFVLRATIVEIMDSMVMSTANVLWNAVGVTVTADGVIENAPETNEDWARLRYAAVTMAEATNSIIIPGRHVAPADIERDPADTSLTPAQIEELIEQNWAAWVGHAHALDAAALEAIRAIDARDVDKLSEVGGTIDAACESCHLQFWYPETG